MSPARKIASAPSTAATRGTERPRIWIFSIRPTAGSSASARKIAVTTQRRVVRVCRIAIASSTASAAQNSATSTILATARASMSLARIGANLVAAPGTAPQRAAALLCLDFDDPPARQPGASPSPPPPGGVIAGRRDSRKRRTGHPKSPEKEDDHEQAGGGPSRTASRSSIRRCATASSRPGSR